VPQGGGLVRAILNDRNGPFKVRALTRDVLSDKARALAALGAETVKADVDDVESLKRAFAGAHGAYCVTFYWAHFSPERELAEARAMAQAAKHAGVKHVIWSTFEDTRKWIPLSDNRMPTLMGKYKVPHGDAKGEANAVFTELAVPTTFLLTSFYWENLIYFGMGPKKGRDGKLAITFPMGNEKLPGIASEDIGKCAYAIFKKGSKYIGQTVGIAGEHLTGAQMASALTQALGTWHTTRYPRRCTVASDSLARRTLAICFSSTATLHRRSVARATSTSVVPSILRFRRLTRGSLRTRAAFRSISHRRARMIRVRHSSTRCRAHVSHQGFLSGRVRARYCFSTGLTPPPIHVIVFRQLAFAQIFAREGDRPPQNVAARLPFCTCPNVLSRSQ